MAVAFSSPMKVWLSMILPSSLAKLLSIKSWSWLTTLSKFSERSQRSDKDSLGTRALCKLLYFHEIQKSLSRLCHLKLWEENWDQIWVFVNMSSFQIRHIPIKGFAELDHSKVNEHLKPWEPSVKEWPKGAERLQLQVKRPLVFRAQKSNLL